MRNIYTSVCLILLAFLNLLCSCRNKDTDMTGNSSTEEVSMFKNKAKYGEEISIHVDFSIPSSEPRFFVYDNKNDSLLSQSKCAHGCGGGSTVDTPVFSNTPGSECSSLGDYKLRSIGKLNTIDMPCIRIDGLSASNSNAASRGIVIHEGPIFADDITIGVKIPVSSYISQGCFTISSNTFNLLCDEMRKNRTIYLYAYK